MSTSIIKATAWSFLQKGGTLVISFVSNMVLARLLTPDDYGTVAMLMVFVGVADVLVDGGLGNALIQKKEVKGEDISTVFTTNLFFSILLYGIIFLNAPIIASYFNIPDLTLYLRVQAISVLLRAFFIIHFSLLNKNMAFKNLALIGLVTNTIATTIAITMAALGCGVWSLILRTLTIDIVSGMLYLIIGRTKVSLGFSSSSFKQLFSFGFFVVCANVIENIYSNILSFLIGKRFSVKDLGYYNQAHSLEQIPVFSISSVVNQVFFPFFSKIQENRHDLRSKMKSTISVMSFFVYPLLAYLIFFGKPVIILLYSEKWLPSVPLFQILCVSGFFNTLLHLCRSTLKAIGQSKRLFLIQLIAVGIGASILIPLLHFNITYLVCGMVVISMVSYFITGSVVGKEVGYSFLEQTKTFSPSFIISFIVCGLAFEVISFLNLNSSILIIVTSLPLCMLLYYGCHSLFRTESFVLVQNAVKEKMNS